MTKISKNKLGFTLIELLLVIGIFSLVLTGVYKLFNTFFSGYKVESKNIETEIESTINTNLIEVDLAHAGLGLADDLDNKPIEWDDSSKTLIIRSVFNATNNKTDKWLLVDCTSGWNRIDNNSYSFSSSESIVFLKTADKGFEANGNFGTCPGSSVYIGFPYDSSVANGCNNQFCNKITYSLSNSSLPDYCNVNTKNLLRKIGNGNGFPVLHCIADFKVTFDYDTDNNSKIDSSERNINIPSGDNAYTIKKNLKVVNVYILMQQGKRDINYQYSGNSVVPAYDENGDGSCDSNDICLNLPSDYGHYRWKIISIKVYPKSLW